MNLRGVRFAPSPTGIFHVGNLRTAWVASCLAKELGEPLVIRIEDIDVARVRADAWPSQSEDLKQIRVTSDITQKQTDHFARHLELFETARREGRVYPCDCSRRDVLLRLAEMTSAPHAAEPEYSGHCRHRHETLKTYRPKETLAWRWKSTDASGVHDAIVARTGPDGSSFAPGYHWACAIDDADGAYHVLVRAWDLAPADDIQKEIREWVSSGRTAPVVFHTSLVTQNDGQRLEKRSRGVTLAELLSKGTSIATLINNFESNFDLPSALNAIRNPQRPAGELQRSVTLSQLSI
ncbi:tRNA glutamyl-Q(34) synthetase GluQRS [soil metagenome]